MTLSRRESATLNYVELVRELCIYRLGQLRILIDKCLIPCENVAPLTTLAIDKWPHSRGKLPDVGIYFCGMALILSNVTLSND